MIMPVAEMEKEKSFSEQIDDYIGGEHNRYDDFKVCDTPAILLVAGCEQKPMLYTQNHFKKAIMPKDIIKHQHGLTTDFIKLVPELLKDPVMILDSISRSDSIVVVLSSRETDIDRCPIVATVHPNGSGIYELETVDSNFITSLYGRENFGSFIQHSVEQDKILYYENKKSHELFSLLGLQFPEGLNNLDSNIIIHQSRNIVKYPKQNISGNESRIDLNEWADPDYLEQRRIAAAEEKEQKFRKERNKMTDVNYGKYAKQSERTRLFVDMDGTLARFHDEPMYLERMFEKGFFSGLKPFDYMVKGLQQFKDTHPEVEIFILSACVDGEPPYCQKEKHQWLDRYLPEIDKEHRIFTKVGAPKSDYIAGGIGTKDYLLDDYNVGLESWMRNGGSPIKAKNNINHKGLRGPLWPGTLIDITEDPRMICFRLEQCICTGSSHNICRSKER